jgi:hypothetical protein
MVISPLFVVHVERHFGAAILQGLEKAVKRGGTLRLLFTGDYLRLQDLF